MMRRRAACFLGAVLMLFATAVQGQQPADEEAAVRQVIENYVVGWRDGDVAKLSDVFDPEGRVMWLSGEPGSEQRNTMTFADVLQRSRAQPQYGAEWNVESLDVLDGRLAVVKVYISRAGGHYLDCLTLQKVASHWRIVNKTFVTR